jgi:hypothetical protein
MVIINECYIPVGFYIYGAKIRKGFLKEIFFLRKQNGEGCAMYYVIIIKYYVLKKKYLIK